jgi:hypothetical protein
VRIIVVFEIQSKGAFAARNGGRFHQHIENTGAALAPRWPCSIGITFAEAPGRRSKRARTVFIEKHETFGLAQLARYKRFVSLLRAMRAMFRGDKVVTAELDRFNRANSGKPRKAQPEAA